MNTVIIPVRLESTRFPNKPLQIIKGKTLLQQSYDSAKKSKLADRVIITTPNKELYDLALTFSGVNKNVILIEGDFKNGTERVAATANALGMEKDDIVVNCQADTFGEDVGMIIDDLIGLAKFNPTQIWTPVMPLKIKDYENENVVKARCREKSPFTRMIGYSRHVGIYAAQKREFDIYLKEPETALEKQMKLEQLRFYKFMNIGFKVYYDNLDVHDINVPEDVEKFNKKFSKNSIRKILGHSQEIADLLNKLGIGTKEVRTVDIHFSVNDVATATVEKNIEVEGELTSVFEKYQLVRKDD